LKTIELAVKNIFSKPVTGNPCTFRVDSDVLAWLKSKGRGHLTGINEILREQMSAELKQ
jgi:uncharacterized protein (DUF4415 family)